RHHYTAALLAATGAVGDPTARLAVHPVPPTPPVLSGRGVTVHLPVRRRRGTARVIDGVDLDIGSGEIGAVTGGTGAGKTTLTHALLGLHRPTDGEIRYAGQRPEPPQP